MAAVAIPMLLMKGISDSMDHMRDEADNARKDQEAKQADLENEMKQNKKDQENQIATTNARNDAKTRQSNMMAGTQGIKSTILTSPLGLNDAPQTANKTLLGA